MFGNVAGGYSLVDRSRSSKSERLVTLLRGLE
jgi:hypothetical protein